MHDAKELIDSRPLLLSLCEHRSETIDQVGAQDRSPRMETSCPDNQRELLPKQGRFGAGGTVAGGRINHSRTVLEQVASFEMVGAVQTWFAPVLLQNSQRDRQSHRVDATYQ